MSKKGIIQNVLVIVLGLAIICMSVGYAAFNVKVSLSGESDVIESPSWSVHLDSPITTSSTTVTSDRVIKMPTINEDGTQVDFSLFLYPGDIYEFTIDVRNTGTFDGKLSTYSLTEKQAGILVSSDNVEGTSTEVSANVYGVTQDEILSKGSYSAKTIRIEALPQAEGQEVTPKTYDFKFNMIYVQNN
ncbi:MAG: hypothetical protein J1F35_05390 [Erysipelotrichales bacterium]|nr:hypothetical protein [Erysipelotrichales bacterium]